MEIDKEICMAKIRYQTQNGLEEEVQSKFRRNTRPRVDGKARC